MQETWRQVGISYLRYSNICAQVVRRSLKEPLRAKAAGRDKADMKVNLAPHPPLAARPIPHTLAASDPRQARDSDVAWLRAQVQSFEDGKRTGIRESPHPQPSSASTQHCTAQHRTAPRSNLSNLPCASIPSCIHSRVGTLS